jgi:hypothetical protein
MEKGRYGGSVIQAIKRDPEELEDYYNKIKTAKDDETKVRSQNQFTWELARRSIAEELVVYPAMEQHVVDGKGRAEKDRVDHATVSICAGDVNFT